MIPEDIKKKFDAICAAVKDGKASLLEVKDKEGKFEYILCIYDTVAPKKSYTHSETEVFMPVARIFKYDSQDNPYELYNPIGG